jgi:hypothetical protein
MQKPATPFAFDFDYWSRLAKHDPEAFERERTQVIDAMIRRVPACRQERLRRLQWKLDQIRRTSGSPLGACLRMNRLMWGAVTGDGGLLEVLNLPVVADKGRKSAPPGCAKILPFKGLQDQKPSG